MESLSRTSAVEAETQNQSSSSRRRHLGTRIATLGENTTAAKKPWSLYEALPNESIRLLRLLIYDSEGMHCHLQTFHENNAPDYDALSYCWGESKEMTTIYCNTRAVQIRASLYTALKHIWKGATLPTRYLWIDAMCLNQNDDDEKAHQVPRMGKIYSLATKTLIWLGEAADDSDAAMAFLETSDVSSRNDDSLKVSTILKMLSCDWGGLTESLSKLDRDELDAILAEAKRIARTFTEGGDDVAELLDVIHSFLVDPIINSHLEELIARRLEQIQDECLIVRALHALISRPWFSRLWVLQELVLSKSCRVICGHVSIEWAALATTISMERELIALLALYASTQAELRLEEWTEFDDFQGRATINRLDRLLKNTAPDQGRRRLHSYAYFELSDIVDSRKCQEPVDRIWAVMALFKETLQQRIRHANIIDYTVIGKQQYWKSYLSFMQLLADENPADFWITVLWSQGRSRHPSLPSWCPDFNSRRQYRNLSNSVTGLARAGFSTADESVAAGIPYTIGTSLLKVHGFAVDVVRTLTDPAPSAEMPSSRKMTNPAPSAERPRSERDYLKFVQQVFSLADEVADFGLIENPIDGVCQVLRGEWLQARWNDDRQNHKGSREFRQAACCAYLTYRRDIKVFAGLIQGIEDDELKLMSTLGRRRFFNTVQGRIGLGPSDLAPGDLVCILPGVAVPLALRAANVELLLKGKVHTAASLEGYMEFFHLIGDAFLFGCMNGEAFTAASRGPDDIFVLV